MSERRLDRDRLWADIADATMHIIRPPARRVTERSSRIVRPRGGAGPLGHCPAVQLLKRTIVLHTAVFALGCWPYNPDELDPGDPPSAEQPERIQSPDTFAADLDSVDVEAAPEHITVTAVNETGVPIGEVELLDDEVLGLTIASHYSDGRFVAILDAIERELWIWPTTLSAEDLARRAALMEDMIGADEVTEADVCGSEVVSLLASCVDEAAQAECIEQMEAVACDCLPAFAAEC
jgi:hypothetical protein